MGYTENKYLADSLRYNFTYKFNGNHEMDFFDLDGNEVDVADILHFLSDEYEIGHKDALQTIVRWTQGDLHADMMDYIDLPYIKG